jgi:hypothetical protein
MSYTDTKTLPWKNRCKGDCHWFYINEDESVTLCVCGRYIYDSGNGSYQKYEREDIK